MSQAFYVSGITPTWIYKQDSDKAEAIQMFFESESWINISDDTDIEDTSEDWKIIPLYVLDPKEEFEWKQDRLWMIDPLDGMLGDDSMPALCSSCNGIFWGDEMISMRKTIHRLRNKHNRSINGMLGNIWQEVEGSVIRKLRLNRICKKCFKVSSEARANPWISNYGNHIHIPANVINQQQLPFNSSSSTSYPPTALCSGMVQPNWQISYSYTDDDENDV